MKIAFFDVKKEEKEFFKLKADFFTYPAHESEGGDYEVISIFITSKITKEVLDKFPKLKYIQTRSTGYDHIDLVECYKRGIIVSNVRNYAGPAVGEFAFSLLFEAIRKTYIAINRVKNGNLDYEDLKGIEIFGKKVGVLGLGAIGRHIVNIAKGLGADVIGYVREKKDIDISQTTSLKEAMDVDFLFIALPLTPKTKNLINKETIKYFRGKVIINPARAEIISKDVYESFDGVIAADVLPDWNLAKKDNIIATPHMAYYTKEALKRIMQISLDNLNDYLSGKKPRYCLKDELMKNY